MGQRSCSHLTFTLWDPDSFGSGFFACTSCGKPADEIFPAKPAGKAETDS